MTIGKTSAVEAAQLINGPQRSGAAAPAAKSDVSVSISADASRKAERLHAIEIVSAAPVAETGAERIAELKAKINDPAYITETLLYETADRILDVILPTSG
jgi:negative regulator of flagellin synthesis FlgM